MKNMQKLLQHERQQLRAYGAMDIRTPPLFDRSEFPLEPRKKRASELHSPLGSVPSLLKWTGSKRSQAARIASLVPPHDRYFEPFLGGGAILFYFARKGSQASDL